MRVGKFICLILMLCGLSASASAVVLELAYEDREQYPYYVGGGANTPESKPGVAVEMLRMLEQKIPGLEVRFTRMPWPRCLASLKGGQVHGIFNASYRRDREALGRYPKRGGVADSYRRITEISYSLYVREGEDIGWTGDPRDRLRGVIGAPRGYSVVGDLRAMGASVEESPWTENDFQKLLTHRLDAVAAQTVTGDSLLGETDRYSGVVRLEPPLRVKPYYLMLSHQFVVEHPLLAEQIWDSIAEIRLEHYQRLLTEY